MRDGTLHSGLKRVAEEHPETRAHLVPLLSKQAGESPWGYSPPPLRSEAEVPLTVGVSVTEALLSKVVERLYPLPLERGSLKWGRQYCEKGQMEWHFEFWCGDVARAVGLGGSGIVSTTFTSGHAVKASLYVSMG